MILCNPPYGERIGEEEELMGLYRLLGEVFERCRGLAAVGLHGQPATWRARSASSRSRRSPFYNGKIPCRLIRFGERRSGKS